ncbi:CAP domain-containing protein [Streptomyces sp. MUM 136J]|uniref:CAP domain-containing protein n=1 Tax=Streptomyces sp. MUM 136J TaxID=2791992 RepID=UPI001F0444FF|nr:CAP domain-containing protein [Streptomyces sp. MUM 136J]MCH0570850.1 CAP domain-containing protein [Streptomyces sp. MUM 136J]
MGRHRRSDAGRAATGRATGDTYTDDSYPGGRVPGGSYGDADAPLGIAPYLNPEAYAEAHTRSQEYLFGTDDISGTAIFASPGFTPDGGSRQVSSHRHRKKKTVPPVRSGLLGVSAAVALGTVAVASGVVPGLDNYRLGGDGGGSGDRIQAADSPTNSPSEQGGTSGAADSRTEAPGSTSRDTSRSLSPSPSASTSSAAPTKTPEEKPEPTPSQTATPSAKPEPTRTPGPTPTPTPTRAAQRTTVPVTVSPEAAVEAEVLRLVNEERAKVGCSPLAANSSLTALAEAFSEDMAARGFFDHTDPDGATPWDRAAKAGITDLGGENIARGQADAAAVMEAWMNSPGHRANILNCDFKTLGVGVHYGSGGPWWTQDFGY